MIRCANDSSAGRARSRASASPPAITRIAPLSTVVTLPETGVSMSTAPVARTSSSSPRIVSGATVLVSATTVPGARPATSPSSPPYVERVAASSASDTITTSAAAAASRAVPATVTSDNREATDSAVARVRFQSVSGWPAAATRPAIAAPIRPVPTTATRHGSHVTSHPPSTYRLVALTPRFSSRKFTPSTMSSMLASRPVGVRLT